MIRMFPVLALWLAMALTPFATMASDDPDYAAIRGVMQGTWDKPDSPVVVEPIVLRGHHALAGWTQGEMGGRALLRKKNTDWVVIYCAGDDLKSADVLRRVGLSQADADALAAMQAAAEKSADPARVFMFSRFEGLVQVTQDSHGPQSHGSPAHHAPSHVPAQGQGKGH